MRFFWALLAVCTILGSVVAATSWQRRAGSSAAEAPGERKLLVCSTTQVADFARQIVGDRWRVRSILAPGQDPHLYEVKPGDATLVAEAQLCAENGWHLEGNDWMAKLCQQVGKSIVSCTDGLEPLKIDAAGVEVHDPHAWFSPKNAEQYVQNLVRAICEADPEHRGEYEARAELYIGHLHQLDGWIKKEVEKIPEKQRVLVTSHDAFGYFCRDYGFKSGAPVGWSTDQETGGGLTPQRRRETIQSIKDFGVKAIFVESSVNPKMIRDIAREAGVEIGGQLYSDSMGSPGEAGETYIGMLRENVVTIVTHLK
jgi:manganese/iron transport system substrate-binding protein